MASFLFLYHHKEKISELKVAAAQYFSMQKEGEQVSQFIAAATCTQEALLLADSDFNCWCAFCERFDNSEL